MADMEKTIAECCKQLKLSSNLAEQAMIQKGENQQEYLLNLLKSEIEYRHMRRKTKYLNTLPSSTDVKTTTTVHLDSFIFSY